MSEKQEDTQSLIAAVHDLSRALHDLIDEEQVFLDGELTRVSSLVREGSDRLMDCFNDMHDLLQDQKRQLRRSVAGTGAGSGESRDVEDALASTGQVNSYLGKAIIALQFEDIVQQLIGHSRQRIATINLLLEMLKPVLEKLSAAMNGGQSDRDEVTAECRRVVEQIRQRLKTDHPVNQDSLNEGSVTLF